MPPWQNGLAIAAGFLVAGSLLPWGLRLACVLGAIGIVCLLLVMRLRSHAPRPPDADTPSVYDRVARLREQREERLGRRPR